MGSIARAGTWDEASSPAATRLARRFEEAWRNSTRTNRPDPGDFLAEGPESTPAAWLALLRVDLNLRWDDGESVRIEDYRDRHPGLDPETLVALCYEEFCRREEDGATPFAAEYDERFPDLADRLRRVFDIHELVGNAESTDLHVPGPDAVPFPEAGQTIAGFFLVEELGRGSFARVFLARERQLADRPVALKVARTGSREPQTLARLQHTHIVPVHSYRTDPATDLHLLCMPYFGRVTLSRLLAEPRARTAPTGRELLEALDRLDPSEAPSGAGSARATLAALPFARAIAWWGARLAEALAHAHDRGVLHRDIKPSNVLVTGDGLPMLLDFNLAREPWDDRGGPDPDRLGGTLAYMAPEHLEALAVNEGDKVDARADVYSLGVLLFEALTGNRPFPAPGPAASVPDALHRAARERRAGPPRIRPDHPEIPASLERVIRRCLDPDPARRFPGAADLARDLQAVADDGPLRSTREPLLVRLALRARRSWKKLALVMAMTAGLATLSTTALRDGQERDRVGRAADRLLYEGKLALVAEDYATATARFDEVARLADTRPELDPSYREARLQAALARETAQARDEAGAFFDRARSLRPRLIGPDARPEEAGPDLEDALAPFRVLTDPRWAADPRLSFLGADRKARLIGEVDELLFLHAAGLAPIGRDAARRAIEICDRARTFTPNPGPWRALRAWAEDAEVRRGQVDLPSGRSASACAEWATLRDRQGDRDAATEWLERAVRIDPDRPWDRYHLAMLHARKGDPALALRHFEAAVALEPRIARFALARAGALRTIAGWARSRGDQAGPATTLRPHPALGRPGQP